MPEPAPGAAPQVLPSEQLQRRAAAALALPVPAVDHEQALPAEALARVLDAIEASTAAATSRAYRSDWDRFAGWAGRRRFPPLPAPPPCWRTTSPRPPPKRPASASGGMPRPRRPGGWPRSTRCTPPPAWTRPAAPRWSAARCPGSAASGPPHETGARPCYLDDIRLLLTALSAEAGGWPSGVAARRDAALLLMGFAGAHRRSELVALTLEDITLPSTDGLHVRLRRS